MWSRQQYTDLTYMGATGPWDSIMIIFGNHVYSWHTIKFGVNRMFHASRPQYTNLTYMGGTGPCGPMRIIFGSVI